MSYIDELIRGRGSVERIQGFHLVDAVLRHATRFTYGQTVAKVLKLMSILQ